MKQPLLEKVFINSKGKLQLCFSNGNYYSMVINKGDNNYIIAEKLCNFAEQLKTDDKLILPSKSKFITCLNCYFKFKVKLDFEGTSKTDCKNCGHTILINEKGHHCWKYEMAKDYNIYNPCGGIILNDKSKRRINGKYGFIDYYCDKHGPF